MSLPASTRRPVSGLIALAIGGFIAWEIVEFTVNRIYVPVGSSLLLQYKGPLLFGRGVKPPDGRLADVSRGEIGVVEAMPGPGRHFYCPIWWVRTIVQDKVVKPGEVAIVTSLMGKDMYAQSTEAGARRAAIDDNSQFLVDGDLGKTEYKGVLRKVYGPGRYRVNPYAYEFKTIQTDMEENGTQTKYSAW